MRLLESCFDRWARAIYRHRENVLVLSLLIVGVGSWAGIGVEQRLFGSVVEIPGAPSQLVATALRDEFAQPFAQLAVVAVRSEARALGDPAFDRHLEAVSQALRTCPTVKQVVGYADGRDPRLLGSGGHVTALLVGLTAASAQEAERATPALRAAIAPASAAWRAADPTVVIATTGTGALAYDLGQLGLADSQRAEAVVLPLTLLLLFVAFGTFVAAAVPLALGLAAAGVTMGLIAGATHLTTLSIMVQNVATMLGLAIGIDYALVVITRFRECLARPGAGVEESLAESMRTAGVAVACSGLTVMVGLAGLAFTPSLNTRSIGVGGALVIGVGVMLALTLLPALLAILGPRIDAPRRFRLPDFGARRRWSRWADTVMARPGLFAAAGIALLAIGMAPLAAARLDYAGANFLPRYDVEFQHGVDLLAGMGQAHAATPINLLVTTTGEAVLDPGPLEKLLHLSALLHRDPRVAEVIGPVDARPGWDAPRYRKLYRHWRSVRQLAPAQMNAFVSRDGRTALVQVVARDTLRFEEVQLLARELSTTALPGLVVNVGGEAALYNDMHEALMSSLPRMGAFVVAATCLLLVLVYRSWLVPLKATVLNLCSVAVAGGALVVLFQWGWGHTLLGLQEPTGGLHPAIMAAVFCVSYGLSMDYEVFLLHRIKEGFDASGDNAQATRDGLAATGGIITAAALIMVTVFAGFAGVHVVMVQMLGVGLAVAVLVDATIVRMMVAPALMRLFGAWNWYPGTPVPQPDSRQVDRGP